MAYKVIILYQLYMPSYFLGTFTEYPYVWILTKICMDFPGENDLSRIRVGLQFSDTFRVNIY